MNTQVNILHTGGNSLQQASSQVEQSIREAPAQTDQPIRQEEAHPDIKDHLAAAPGNRVEGDVLPIAESAEKGAEAVSYNPLEGVEGIQDNKQPGAVYLRVAQDSQEPTSCRLWAVQPIEDSNDRHAAYLSIIQDSQAYIADRLMAAHRIKVETGANLFDALYPDFPKYLEANIRCRLWAAALIKDPTERDNALIGIANNHEEDIHYRLEAAKLIANATEQDNTLIGIAKDHEEDIHYRLEAAEKITDPNIRDEAYLYIAKYCNDETFAASCRLKAAEKITDPHMRDEAYLTLVQDHPFDRLRFPPVQTFDPFMVEPFRVKSSNPYLSDIVLQIQDTTKRDTAYSYIAEDPEVDIDDRLEAAGEIKNNPIQGESYRSIIETLLSRDAFGCMEQLITVVQDIADIQVKNLVIKAIYQNWPLVEEGQLQEHLLAFRRLYELASDDGRTDLITAIVTRTEVDAGFRKAVVKEHVKDATEQERLVKAIEEGQEGSLNGPQTKRAR